MSFKCEHCGTGIIGTLENYQNNCLHYKNGNPVSSQKTIDEIISELKKFECFFVQDNTTVKCSCGGGDAYMQVKELLTSLQEQAEKEGVRKGLVTAKQTIDDYILSAYKDKPFKETRYVLENLKYLFDQELKSLERPLKDNE